MKMAEESPFFEFGGQIDFQLEIHPFSKNRAAEAENNYRLVVAAS
jgi:hypothetical protein